MKAVGRKRLIKVILVIIMLNLMGFISPLKLTRYDMYSDNLPKEFDGYRIVQISDFHCKEFGDQEDHLISMVKEAQPDLIVLTGDIVDEEHTAENAGYLLEGIAEIAPVYYVTGNHEYYSGAPLDVFKELCFDYGVEILDNEMKEIEKDGAIIRISGLDWNRAARNMIDKLGYADPKFFNILLYHDALRFNFLSEFGYDVVFTGHLHGGLIRLPFIGGLLSSDYSLFPKYSQGIYHDKNSTMVCSAGLGDARVPRWNNPREVVLVQLHRN